MTEVKLGINLWSQASDWPSFLAAGRRAEALGYDHLWTWDHIYAIFGDPYQPILEGYTALAALAQATERIRLGLFVGANTFRNPGLTVKSRRRRSTTSAAAGRSSASAARGSSCEHDAFGIEFGDGFGQRLDWLDESVSGDPDAARRRRGDEPARRPLRVRPAADLAAAGPGPPPDHDRRRRREEDAPDRRPSTPTCGTCSGRPRRSPARTRSCASTARPSAATPPRSSGRSASSRRSGRPPRRPSGPGSTSSPRTGRRPPGWKATSRSGSGRRSRSPRRWLSYRKVGFHTFIAELPAPYDAETMETLMNVVKPMVEGAPVPS